MKFKWVHWIKCKPFISFYFIFNKTVSLIHKMDNSFDKELSIL